MNGDEARHRRVFAVAGGLLALAIAVALVLTLTAGSGNGARTSSTAASSRPPPAPAPPPLPLPPGPPARPAPRGEQFGVSVNRLFNARDQPLAEIDRQLAALEDTGATVARSDALWEASEPQAPTGAVHHYDWSFDDLIAGSLATHGLRWLPIVDYSAPWAQSEPGVDHSPPKAAGDYARYASALAARYGPGGAFWRTHPELRPEPVDAYEIWNEPDNAGFFFPRADPARYADLYLQARAAIAAADPHARVLVGGISTARTFLPAMLAARPQLRGHIDGVSVHVYAPNPAGVLANVRSARAGLRAAGMPSVPLYVTEFGWPTHPPSAENWAPERLRPSYILRTIDALGHSDCAIAGVFLYTWVSPEQNPANADDWFGINPPGRGRSADTIAFTAGLRRARAPGRERPVCANR